MLAKLFAFIDLYKELRDFAKFLVKEWTQFQIAKYGNTLDEKQIQRNAYLDAIVKAQEERNAEKVMAYSRLLAMSDEL